MVVFFLPFQPWLGKENDQAGSYAARSWAESYVATNQLIQHINDPSEEALEEAGYRAAITPATHNFDEQKLDQSLVSQTSGLSRRVGDLRLSPSADHGSRVLRASGKPGHQHGRCPLRRGPPPNGAWKKPEATAWLVCRNAPMKPFLKTRYDRHRCYEQCLINDRYYHDLPLVDVCGKCACEVPCSYRIPTSAAEE